MDQGKRKIVVMFVRIFMVDGLSEMRMRSSAKARQLKHMLVTMLTPKDGGRISSSSSRMRLNRMRLTGSPCLMPRKSLTLGKLVGSQRIVVVQLE